MRFFIYILFFSFFSLLSAANAEENLCMRVNTNSQPLEVKTQRSGGGVSCGRVQAGQNLFRSGTCRDGYCPIAFRSGACKNNDGGIGWVRDQTITRCIVDHANLMSLQPDDDNFDQITGSHRAQSSCYKITSPAGLIVKSSATDRSTTCGKFETGQTLTPAGSCGDFWCPVFVYKEGSACTGIGYVNKGRFSSERHIEPCSEEVSSVHTRRIAQRALQYGGAGRLNTGGGNSELASSSTNTATARYNQDINNYFSSTGGNSLPFVRRCNTSNCNKAAERGYPINFYNGCSGDVKFVLGEGRGARCSETFPMNEQMKTALTNNLPSCVKAAARSLGLGEVETMSVQTSGCFVYRTKRNSSALSEHGKGSAIDINSITLNYTGGGSRTMSMHINNQATDGRFHDLLYQCWNRMGGSCSASLSYNSGTCGSSTGGSSSLRELHRDHLHLTYNCRRGGGC